MPRIGTGAKGSEAIGVEVCLPSPATLTAERWGIAMQAKARRVGPARSLELETDTATLKRMMTMIGGTVAIVAVLGVAGILLASGSLTSRFIGPAYMSGPAVTADRYAKQIEMTCRIGAVALVASRDPVKAEAGRELANQCDEVGNSVRWSLPFWR